MTVPTGEGIPVQYRFVADEQTADQYARASLQLRGVRLVVIGVLGLVLWSLLTLLVIVALRHTLEGPDLLLGSLIIGLLLTAAYFVFLYYAGKALLRRFFRRHWPVGTILETGFVPDGMLLSRNGDGRMVSYADIRRVRRTQAMAQVVLGFGAVAFFPSGLFPDDAMALLKDGRKAGRRRPPAPVTFAGEVTEFVVPPGWASTVAGTFLRVTLTRSAMYVRLGALEVIVLLAVALGLSWWWLLVPPVLILLLLTRGYVGSRTRFETGQPEGAVLSVTVGDDRFAYERPSRIDVFRYDDVLRAHVQGDVTALEVRGYRALWMLPTVLVPQQLSELGATSRS